MKEDYILQALRALAENDRESEASPEAEVRVLGAFHARRRSGRRWAAIAALAAGLAMAALWWTNLGPRPAVSVVQPIPLIRAVVQPTPEVEPTPNVVRAPRKTAPKAVAVRQPERRPEPREVFTDFFPLMNPEPSFERGQILRVQLPASAMQSVGLPVREEHLGDLVQADVVVGEEGMPRAIRFVRFDVK